MPLFGRSSQPPVQLDERLRACLPEGDRELRKIMEREGTAITSAMLDDEEVLFAGHSESAFATSVNYYAAVVVTSESLLVVHKGQVTEWLRDEIRDVSMAYDANAGAFLCKILTRTGACAVHIASDRRAIAFVSVLGFSPY